MRCVTPASGGRSSRAPTPTKTPTATERTDSIFSEMTRRPSGSVVCSCTGLSVREMARAPPVWPQARHTRGVRLRWSPWALDHRDERVDDRGVELRPGMLWSSMSACSTLRALR